MGTVPLYARQRELDVTGTGTLASTRTPTPHSRATTKHTAVEGEVELISVRSVWVFLQNKGNRGVFVLQEGERWRPWGGREEERKTETSR